MNNLLDLAISLPAVIIAITLHELAHGYVSYKLGDPTAKNAGRLTLNPFKHLDPIGTLSMILLHFGWAKPVPVNPNYYKNPKRGMVLVGLAGPVTNILLAFVSILGMQLIFIRTNGYVGDVTYYIFNFLQYSSVINISLAAFNMIPFPPLDGSKIITGLLPDHMYFKLMRYEKYTYFILLAVLLLGGLDKFLNGMVNVTYNFLWMLIG